ncbi:MAG: CoA ester lyase [Betaproteobacteria bacterium]|nr:CoA ester lyase [Betaproteobacteria bacterium]NBT76010.1 CoA ester lyase [Betaproteobacteria bacterium]NCA16713.1 CoA ester lyase [Betaproteobacteria bacterium]
MSNLSARNCRASLFWGALRLSDFQSLGHTDADIFCIDLEDAVPPSEKDKGRAALKTFLQSHTPSPNTRYIVRVNECQTRDGDLDLELLIGESGFVSHLLIPKLESVSALEKVSELLDRKGSDLGLLGIIETPLGLEIASALAASRSRLKGFYFGGFDLSNSLGCEMDWNALSYARSRVVHAAALGELLVIDSPPPFVDETPEKVDLIKYCRTSKSFGMMGMVTKHVSQISSIQSVFSPSEKEIERARKILDMYLSDPSQPIVFEGKLIERPTIKKLQRLI